MATRIARPITDWDSVPILIDVAMAATIIGKSYEATRRLAAKGCLPATKIGSEWRIDKGALMRQLGAAG